jgi:spore maturation protein SpmA
MVDQAEDNKALTQKRIADECAAVGAHQAVQYGIAVSSTDYIGIAVGIIVILGLFVGLLIIARPQVLSRCTATIWRCRSRHLIWP